MVPCRAWIGVSSNPSLRAQPSSTCIGFHSARGRMLYEQGVVVEAPVGCRVAGHFRIFQYEIRRWEGGTIPDLSSAVGSPVNVTSDAALVDRALAVVPFVPAATWGRDELHAGEMWNSNSVVAWILTQIGLIDAVGDPPHHGRAPGWVAGVAVGGRGLQESSAVSGVAS